MDDLLLVRVSAVERGRLAVGLPPTLWVLPEETLPGALLLRLQPTLGDPPPAVAGRVADRRGRLHLTPAEAHALGRAPVLVALAHGSTVLVLCSALTLGDAQSHDRLLLAVEDLHNG